MIAEKSLELNVCENIINRIRSLDNAFSRAFLYGFTIRQEGKHGLDVSINLPSTSKFLFALQYKAPKRKIKGNRYVFEINNNTKRDQHIRLLLTALRTSEEVYYVFPLFIDTNELSRNSPVFLSRTYFAKIIDFPPCTFDRRKHVVKVDPQAGKAYVSSPTEHEIKIYDVDKFFKELEGRHNKLENVGRIKEKKLTKEDVIETLKEMGFEEVNIKIVLEVFDKMKTHYVRQSFWI